MTITAKPHAVAGSDAIELWADNSLWAVVQVDFFWHRNANPDTKLIYDRLREGHTVELTLVQSTHPVEVPA